MSGGRDWLAFAVGAYGAVVASCVAIYQFYRDRPGVKLVLRAITAVSEKNPEPVELWGIRVVNHRKRPITIQEVGVSRGRLRISGLPVDFYGERVTDPFPAMLEDGGAVEVYINRNDGFGTVTGAWARDALDHPYKCRFPNRNPRERWREWRNERAVDRMVRDRERRAESPDQR
jgi:hypothetical protein